MKKANSIRLFFVLCTLGCVGAYAGGYYYSASQSQEEEQNESKEDKEKNTQTKTDEPQKDSAQSAAVVVPYKYVLGAEDGYVIVYYADQETVYETTDIWVEGLSTELQKEIKEGKYIYSASELYNFLESYSS